MRARHTLQSLFARLNVQTSQLSMLHTDAKAVAVATKMAVREVERVQSGITMGTRALEVRGVQRECSSPGLRVLTHTLMQALLGGAISDKREALETSAVEFDRCVKALTMQQESMMLVRAVCVASQAHVCRAPMTRRTCVSDNGGASGAASRGTTAGRNRCQAAQ